MEKVLSHAIERIRDWPLKTEPYCHFHLERVFPDSFYSELIGNFPDLSYYNNSESYPQRYDLALAEEALRNLPLAHFFFWWTFTRTIHSQSFLFAVLEKFQPQVEKRFGTNFRDLKFYVHTSLLCDMDHYSIGPHTDHPAKVISLLFYLPDSIDQLELGTSLYRPLDSSYPFNGRDHYPFSWFAKTDKIPFLPNSVFGFFRTNNSFHGVEPLGKLEKARHLITYTIWQPNEGNNPF